MDIKDLSYCIEAFHHAPSDAALVDLRQKIAFVIAQQLVRVQHTLGYWEKRHLFDAIYALHTNIERAEAGVGLLHLCLFCLSYVDLPTAQRDDLGTAIDKRIDMLTYEELADQLAAINQALARSLNATPPSVSQ